LAHVCQREKTFIDPLITLRYLTQLVGLVTQNFLAGAAGLAAGFAFIRGMARERSGTIGNFWVDLVRRCSGCSCP
jgi:K+-transporting ATPase ATPase A chain